MTRRHLLALIAAAPACSPRRPATETVLRVGVAQSAHSVAPLFLADEMGFFRQEGIRIEVDRTSFTGLHISALAAGKLDVAMVAMSPALVNSAAQGAPIRLVASRKYLGGDCGAWGQFYSNLSAFPGGLKDFHELIGKRIAYSTPGSLTDFALDAVLDSACISRDRVKAVAVRRQESVAALLTGNLDAVINVPSLAEIPEARRTHFGYLRGADTVYPKLQTSFTAFGGRLLTTERETGLRFLRAFRRGSEAFFAGTNPVFMRRWAFEQGADPDTPVQVCPHEVDSDGAVDPESVRLYLDWAARRKHVATAIEPGKLIDSTLIADLNRGAIK
ncbi:MAG: ABC transporter substrate-binding protein [Acidobacteria bacterium]|nr:ABC transporter substrate-binding protein [Acidobacteriota bacterium]